MVRVATVTGRSGVANIILPLVILSVVRKQRSDPSMRFVGCGLPQYVGNSSAPDHLLVTKEMKVRSVERCRAAVDCCWRRRTMSNGNMENSSTYWTPGYSLQAANTADARAVFVTLEIMVAHEVCCLTAHLIYFSGFHFRSF